MQIIYMHTCLLILQPNWLDCDAQYTIKIQWIQNSYV